MPEQASHNITVLLLLPVTRRVPSLLIATLSPQACSLPVRASHTFTLRSILPLTMRLASLLIATPRTPLACPRSVRRFLPVRASHIFTVPS